MNTVVFVPTSRHTRPLSTDHQSSLSRPRSSATPWDRLQSKEKWESREGKTTWNGRRSHPVLPSEEEGNFRHLLTKSTPEKGRGRREKEGKQTLEWHYQRERKTAGENYRKWAEKTKSVDFGSNPIPTAQRPRPATAIWELATCFRQPTRPAQHLRPTLQLDPPAASSLRPNRRIGLVHHTQSARDWTQNLTCDRPERLHGTCASTQNLLAHAVASCCTMCHRPTQKSLRFSWLKRLDSVSSTALRLQRDFSARKYIFGPFSNTLSDLINKVILMPYFTISSFIYGYYSEILMKAMNDQIGIGDQR